MAFDARVVDGRHQHGDRRDGDEREQRRRQQVRGAAPQQQVHRALCEGRPSKERPRDVPRAKDGLAPSHQRRHCFGEGADAVREDAEAPPEQMQPIRMLPVAAQDLHRERQRQDRRDDRHVVDERGALHQNAPTLSPMATLRPRDGANWKCSR
jgi:hypothetical protein